MQGFLAKAFAFDYDVCTFATYRKYQDTSEREVGETSIFSLIDYDAFDGVVVLPETLQTPGLMLTLEQDFREKFQGKILYVDRKSDEYNYIMLDHYHPIKRMIAHLIEEHGIKDIMYLTGPRYNAHSEQRLQGFLDCMKEHDIDVREDQIFYGDYWYDGGRDMVKKLFDDGRALPQAIACANDLMAIGVAEALVEWGLYDKVWQAGTILLPVKSVGVMGDERTYESCVALRAVTSTDGMTADWVHLPYDFLARVSNDIINRVRGINRVVYDISSKPPATIEWE